MTARTTFVCELCRFDVPARELMLRQVDEATGRAVYVCEGCIDAWRDDPEARLGRFRAALEAARAELAALDPAAASAAAALLLEVAAAATRAAADRHVRDAEAAGHRPALYALYLAERLAEVADELPNDLRYWASL